MKATPRWFTTAPASAGLYEFKCGETGEDIETVKVESRKGTLWAHMDGLWNPVNFYHDGLTRPQWRRVSDLPEPEREGTTHPI